MSTNGEKKDRRARKRYDVNNNALSINSNKPGQVVDISSMGISFELTKKQKWPDGELDLDVLYGENDFYLDNMPLKFISDHKMSQIKSNVKGKLARRCGFQFGPLTKEQNKQLEYFISVNSICKKNPRRS